MSHNKLSEEDLLEVAQHGNGVLEKSLAVVLYCKRKNELDRLQGLTESDEANSTGERA